MVPKMKWVKFPPEEPCDGASEAATSHESIHHHLKLCESYSYETIADVEAGPYASLPLIYQKHDETQSSWRGLSSPYFSP